MSTEIGAIQGAVTEAGQDDPTPLQKKLDEPGAEISGLSHLGPLSLATAPFESTRFGTTLARIIFAICLLARAGCFKLSIQQWMQRSGAIVWAINYKHFTDPVHGSFLQARVPPTLNLWVGHPGHPVICLWRAASTTSRLRLRWRWQRFQRDSLR